MQEENLLSSPNHQITKSPNRNKALLTLLGILFMPALLYLLLSTGKNQYKKLEVYGPKDVDEKGDTLYHAVPSFTFTNQKGNAFGADQLKDKIYVANFFFATCPNICKPMNENVKKVADKYKDDSRVQFVSFTVNPEHDTPEVLAEYAKERGADSIKWNFLTGNKDSIYNVAREGFLLPAGEGEKANDFLHSQDLILVDKSNRIRGIYDGLEDAEIKRLTDEIKVLEIEYK